MEIRRIRQTEAEAVADLWDEAGGRAAFGAIRWFESGRLMTLQQLVGSARGKAIPPIFKLPQLRKGFVLVTPEFLDIVEGQQLTGLAPREIGRIEP